MLTFQYTRAYNQEFFSLPSPEDILFSLSEPLLETGDIKKALQQFINLGEGKQLKGLEELLSETRKIKDTFLQTYNLNSALDNIQNELEKGSGWSGLTSHKTDSPARERKGGARVLNVAELREELQAKSTRSLHHLFFLLKNLTENLPFTGSQPLSLEELPEFIERINLILQVEKDLQRAVWGYDLETIESKPIGELLGEEALLSWEYFKGVKSKLEKAGLLEQIKNNYRLTRRGVYLISSKILKDIFDLLKRDLLGKHPASSSGNTGIDLTNSKPYSFDLPLNINLPRTLMNAIIRQGSSSPLTLEPQDFEIYEPEYFTRSATVLGLDMSQSMKDRNNFLTAKKVALALNELIRRRFPQDYLAIVGFSTLARQVTPAELPYLRWDAEQSYTNIQDALRLSRQLLKQKSRHNKQVILITDGEPTAHYEGNRLYFQFPPHPATIEHTLEEVKQCTREGIIIHIFMMVKSNPLTNFVEEVIRINPGQAYYTNSETLGENIILNYLVKKKKR
jgi:uncharacterized protein with von Willebrand factor type A (vWA) domain